MAALRERLFYTQLLLSLSVFLHRRYGSERLIDVLYSLGFAASYGNTVRNFNSLTSTALYFIIGIRRTSTICWRQCQYILPIDFLWLYGKLKNISSLSGWNGFLEQLTKKNKDFSSQARDDADVLIVETAIEESEYHKTAVIVEDIDLLIILIKHTQSHQEEVFFKKVENLPNLDQLAQVFQEENCPVQTLHENGV
ncbi:hypothetical protein TNIN_123941 [Trichonephila inaurata madagascariensis]|uniref:Uncharacterized protein n=1 Tax=Trichonephila inaurata madagascariensis TaxID=2747483 RepID=A0A8X6KK28_9ARAC|nr:hypothetical protein TNIN_123941 [Trichonephila inaurata madagascariensis]